MRIIMFTTSTSDKPPVAGTITDAYSNRIGTVKK